MTSKSNGSLVAVLDRVIGVPCSDDENAEKEPEFLPSSKFTGSKAGYVFRTDHLGTGYYRDDGVPARDTKRIKLDDPRDDVADRPRSVRFDPAKDSTVAVPSRRRPPPSGDELLAQAEQQQQQQPSPTAPGRHLLDPHSDKSIRSASAALRKTHSKNTVLRARHPDDPETFLANELQMYDEIVAFQNAAVHLPSYETMVRCGVVETFLALLSHDNSDVAMAVVAVLAELLDPALLREGADGMRRNRRHDDEDEDEDEEAASRRRADNIRLLGETFIRGGGLEALAANLGRFDESVPEDAKGVEDTLTLLEALLDFERAGVWRDPAAPRRDPPASLVASICNAKLLSWLFLRIQKDNDARDDDRDDDDAAASAPISPAVIRLHASELLATILQHEDYSIEGCGARLASCPEYSSVFDETDEKPRAEAALDDETDARGANHDKNKTNVDGMEILLLSIAAYRKSDPRIEVECEFLENVFDALAASLLRADNVADFVEKEGIELMLRCIREKVHSGGGALKVLNFALSGSAHDLSREQNNDERRIPCDSNRVHKKACEVFVRAGGLKLLFPLFMARKSVIPSPAACSEGGSDLAKKAIVDGGKSAGGAPSKRARRAARARKKWLAEVEENVVHVLYALTRHVDRDSKYDSYSRLLVKFVEEECEKCDRTIELCLKYDEKARISEYQYFRSDEAEQAEQLGLDVDVAALGAKLRGGGDIFHRLCAILSFACVGSARSHGHVRDQLKLQGSSISVIKEGLTEFASLLIAGSQKTQIEHYLSNI